MGKPRIKVSAHSLIMREARATGQPKDKLTATQLGCLREIAEWSRTIGYPGHWKPATRKKLVEMGLVGPGQKHSDHFVLTDAGRSALNQSEGGE